MPTLALKLTQTGNFFTRINEDLTGAMGEALDELGEKGEDRVLKYLGISLMNPTGHYESSIAHYRRSPLVEVITDSGVIYGPWLEGTGSRNSPVTSFEGYHTFQDVTMDLEDMAESVFDKHIKNTPAFLQ